LSLPETLAQELRQIPGVAATTPVGQNLEFKARAVSESVKLTASSSNRFLAASKLRIVEGQPLANEGDIAIVDGTYLKEKKIKIGDKVEGLDRQLTIVGVYEPELGPRIKIPLSTMQQSLGVSGKCSMIYVKCNDSREQEQVAKAIVARFPELRIIFTQNLPELYATGYTGFNVFLNIIAGLATIISLLVILLTMYTTVTERTRQIGIPQVTWSVERFCGWSFCS
jgi:ABC-type antimicrobial peptide transport system permease subunit